MSKANQLGIQILNVTVQCNRGFNLNGYTYRTECNMECILTEKRGDTLSAVVRGQTEVDLLSETKKKKQFLESMAD